MRPSPNPYRPHPCAPRPHNPPAANRRHASPERYSRCVSFPRSRTHGRPTFPPRRHRWPTSSCARRPRKSRWPARTPTSTRKADMVRTIVYLFVAIVVLATIATPGLGAFALVFAPLLGRGLLWRAALTAPPGGRSLDAVAHTRQSHLLGPGGPDDSFAAARLD